MNSNEQIGTADRDTLGGEMYHLIQRLYPICRSITGDGVRETLKIVQEYIPLMLHEVPSGTTAFDWIVPNEWNIRDAYIKNSRGERIIDYRSSNLHVLNYSVPIHCTMNLDALRPHLFSLPEHPSWIPYRTSYYQEQWGFCLSHEQLLTLEDDMYEVCIDSSLAPGSLTYGEYVLPGATEDEILISCHICHPSLCNDNLSGIALAVQLAQYLWSKDRRYTYRFLFMPGTIGAITWLSTHEAQTSLIKHGLVLSCVGDPGQFTYKKSRRETAEIDRVADHVFRHADIVYELRPFTPFGYDERQYCSPGFNLPVGSFMRTPNGCYPEYHTSADNLELVQPAALADSLAICRQIMTVLEHDRVFINQNPKCEPQLGRRGLYDGVSEQTRNAMLWTLNLTDGNHTLLAIAERAGLPFDVIYTAAALLAEHGLLMCEQ